MAKDSIPLFNEILIKRFVKKFYENVLEDERINLFFKKIDMETQKEKQVQFLYNLMQYDNNKKEDDFSQENILKRKHEHLFKSKNLNEFHFNAIIENFEKSCSDLMIPQKISTKLIAKISALKNNILP